MYSRSGECLYTYVCRLSGDGFAIHLNNKQLWVYAYASGSETVKSEMVPLKIIIKE